jgi:hypothetical protein
MNAHCEAKLKTRERRRTRPSAKSLSAASATVTPSARHEPSWPNSDNFRACSDLEPSALIQYGETVGALPDYEADAAFQPRHAASYHDYGDDRGEILDRLE